MDRFTIRPEDPDQPLEEIWPPFGLRLETPRLALRVVRETDFPAWVAAATSGVTRTERNPFAHAWNENSPEELVRGSLPWLWSTRSSFGPDSWTLLLAVFLKPLERHGVIETAGDDETAPVVRDGERLIGMQDCAAAEWPVLATVSSGSWLAADHQGVGYGREMRSGMLQWAFDHFGAAFAESGAYTWNEPSRRVSLGLGYQVVGRRRVSDAQGRAAEWEDQFRLAAEDFRRPDWTVGVQGAERLRAFFAADGAGADGRSGADGA
ncbi:GNAT family N-acetyltransferase [Nesterenkonia sp. F]|uniref:GNAT family N-acetyltransferase n=1 Tax=Nesterenkonia sp. F TaxID=795955 RepID=UPI000255D24C|nr:GNAT family protein [Nesterenkonia sp. F]